ncbi:MAG: hypothetical protein L6Q55_05745 [Azonexus sp.]|nr:hypothetical protein [Azonexus sp.]MCK6411917.1 hypothetical protein [Azonexus sp.]
MMIADPRFAERVRASFARQHAMALIRATLPVVEAGRTGHTLIVTQAEVFAVKAEK